MADTPALYFPTIKSPTSTLYKGLTTRFEWTTAFNPNNVAYAGNAACAQVLYQYKAKDTSNWASVSLATNATYCDFDTTNVASTAGMVWRVAMQTNNGAWAYSAEQTNDFKQVTITIGDMYPSSGVKLYKGFDTTFRWAMSYAVPTGYSGTIKQTSAQLRWRAKGAASYTSINIAGAASTYKMGGGVLSVGNIEWCVAVTHSGGATVTSSWVAFTNNEIAIALTGLYPASGAVCVKSAATVFGWSMEAADSTSAPGLITQTSAVFKWRPVGGTYKTVNIQGAVSSYTLPAGTFTADAIEWCVSVTASTGTSANSAVIPISTVDTKSTPVCIAPIGEVLDGNVDIVFAWQHINATNTTQSAWELEISTNAGATYTRIANGSTAAQSYICPAKTLTSGIMLWRVRTANSDGAFGEYSAAATIIVKSAPNKPAITSVTSAPLVTVKWSVSGQLAYLITIDDYNTGWVYSADKVYTHKMLLEDGLHTVTIKVQAAYGLVSEMTQSIFTTRNAASGSIIAKAEETDVGISITFTPTGDFAAYYIIKDGKAIARAQGQDYVDCMAAGEHEYIVRGITADGFYTDADAVTANYLPQNAVIGKAGAWVELRLKKGGKPTHTSTVNLNKTFVNYYGRAEPVAFDAQTETITHTFGFTFREKSIYGALLALRHDTVIYKDCYGVCIEGVMSSVETTHQNSADCTFTIIETAREKEVLYEI
ncbi:MAG: hypothetical protein GXZ14_00815 [Ruminococcaceae bacterium]|nr:hypothetical protein [Oscillospiraceae bacterium]